MLELDLQKYLKFFDIKKQPTVDSGEIPHAMTFDCAPGAMDKETAKYLARALERLISSGNMRPQQEFVLWQFIRVLNGNSSKIVSRLQPQEKYGDNKRALVLELNDHKNERQTPLFEEVAFHLKQLLGEKNFEASHIKKLKELHLNYGVQFTVLVLFAFGYTEEKV